MPEALCITCGTAARAEDRRDCPTCLEVIRQRELAAETAAEVATLYVDGERDWDDLRRAAEAWETARDAYAVREDLDLIPCPRHGGSECGVCRGLGHVRRRDLCTDCLEAQASLYDYLCTDCRDIRDRQSRPSVAEQHGAMEERAREVFALADGRAR